MSEERGRTFITIPDDPEADGTDFAHPAWWRGHEQSTEMMIYHVNQILDDIIKGQQPSGTYGNANMNKLRERLYNLYSNRSV